MPASVKATVPLWGAGVTVAVYVTCWPAVEGLVSEERVVAVAAGATVCVSGDDAESSKLLSPE